MRKYVVIRGKYMPRESVIMSGFVDDNWEEFDSLEAANDAAENLFERNPDKGFFVQVAYGSTYFNQDEDDEVLDTSDIDWDNSCYGNVYNMHGEELNKSYAQCDYRIMTRWKED